MRWTFLRAQEGGGDFLSGFATFSIVCSLLLLLLFVVFVSG
jgi:hypothetical protein